MTVAPSTARAPLGWWASTGWLAGGHVVTVVLRLIALVAVARALGVDDVGLVVVGLSLGGALAMTFSGTQTVGVIAASQHPDQVRSIRDAAVRQQLAIAAAGLTVVAMGLAVWQPRGSWVLFLFALSALTQTVTLRWLLVALGDARYAATVVAVGAGLFLIGCLVAVRGPDDLWRVAALHVGVEVVVAAVLWTRSTLLYQTDDATSADFSLRRSLVLSTLQAARIAPLLLSVVVVSIVLSESEAGRFSLLQRAALAGFAVVALHTEAGTAPLVGRAGSRERVGRATAPLVGATLVVAGAAFVLADPVVDLVLNDETYRGLGGLAALFVLALGAGLLSGPRQQIGVADGREGWLLVASAGAAVGTIVLAASLLPSLGLIAVGWAELAGQAAFLAFTIRIRAR
ncbi:MAG: hypothetical protein HKN26_08425 [Acidimicrobiales bacterium]|nr:hypothetical protein [Acidimicrobiales bacterium]